MQGLILVLDIWKCLCILYLLLFSLPFDSVSYPDDEIVENLRVSNFLAMFCF